MFIKRNISNYVEQYLMQLMKISTTKNSVNKIYNETIKNTAKITFFDRKIPKKSTFYREICDSIISQYREIRQNLPR